MPVFQSAGRSLHYLDEGSGPPVLLLHAFPLNAESFRAQAGSLSHKARFLLPDLRGFGKSGPPGPEGSDMALLARDALGLLDHLGIEQAVVGGVSVGGYVSLAVLREDPSRVRGLILADTQATADDEAAKGRRRDLVGRLERLGEGPAGREHLLESLPNLLAQPPKPSVQAEASRLVRQASVAGAIALQRGMAARPDSRELLARYAGPTLVVVGERDAVTPPARAQEMASLVSGAKLVEIPEAGHLAHLERPEAFNAALGAFLDQSGQRAAGTVKL